MKSHYLLFLAIPVIISACHNESQDPQATEGQKQLQSVELHYPSGQIDYDSMFYSGTELTKHGRQSTGWIDIINYSFEYSSTSTSVFLEQNGNPSVDFVKKDILDNEQRLAQTIVKKEDGSLFATYDFVYDTDGTLVAQHISDEGQQRLDSIEVDERGNHIVSKRIGEGIRVVVTYDENPNPFYRLPIIINTFQTHSPNNLTRFQIFEDGDLSYEKTFQYQYGPDDYPTQVVVQGSLEDEPEETYFFRY